MPNYATRAPHIELIAEMIREALVNINTIALAKVQTVSNGRANVNLLHKMLSDSIRSDGKNEEIEIPTLQGVPIAYFGSPEFKVFREPKPGDLGLVLVNQRSADRVKSSDLEGQIAEPSAPSNPRMFDINDGIFFPIYLGGQGPAGFAGMTGKGLTPGGGPKIGLEPDPAFGGKLKLQGGGPTSSFSPDIVEILEDQQSQIDRLNDAVVSVSTSGGPVTAGALPVAVKTKVQNTLSKIKMDIKKQFGLANPAGLLALADVALKIVKVAADGTPEYAPRPVNFTNSGPPTAPTVNVAIQPRGLYSSGGGRSRDVYGFITNGVDGLSGGRFPALSEEGGNQGEGDFSIFGDTKEGMGLRDWAQCVGAYFYFDTASSRNWFCFVFPSAEPDLSGVESVRIAFKRRDDPDFQPERDQIGNVVLGDSRNPIPLFDPQSPTSDFSKLWGKWGALSNRDYPNNINKIRENAVGFWASLFAGGLWVPKYPVWYLDFYDHNLDPITLDVPGLET